MISPNARPRMLFLAPLVPSDRGNGLAMRTGFFLESYARQFTVDVAIVPVATDAAEVSEFVRVRSNRAKIFQATSIDTHFKFVTSVAEPAARLAAFRQYGRPSLTSRLTAELTQALAAWVGDQLYSVIHVSRLYLAPVVGRWMVGGIARPRLVIDCDEDDAQAYRGFAAREWHKGNIHGGDWQRAESEGFARLAMDWLPRFDVRLAASRDEARSLRARAPHTPVAVMPNVTPTATGSQMRRPHKARARTIVFVGTMGYAPNVDGVLWFVSRVWPLLRKAVPFPLRFLVVGADPPVTLTRLHRRQAINITGRVEDVGCWYRGADVAIVPVHTGGGTRIKLLEAARYRVPIVSTRFGMRGTRFRGGHDILVADDARAFARACAALLMDRRQADTIAGRALLRVRQDHVPKMWGDRLLELVDAPTEGDKLDEAR